ncbi:hypothetical protein [Methylopila sp. M107]|uniref:hypothetical protein n=1 Tax=Methylopila sp. M107 TaxID=1101190 RepID=UPI000371EE85|nr:hypothetical protein [Methylopila sp. M107]
MSDKGKSFSIIRLNPEETGWGVVDDATGALVHLDGMALRLTKQRAKDVATQLNDEARESGSAADGDRPS